MVARSGSTIDATNAVSTSRENCKVSTKEGAVPISRFHRTFCAPETSYMCQLCDEGYAEVALSNTILISVEAPGVRAIQAESRSAAVEQIKGRRPGETTSRQRASGALDGKPTASKILTEFVEGFYSIGELECCRVPYVREFSERASLLLRFQLAGRPSGENPGEAPDIRDSQGESKAMSHAKFGRSLAVAVGVAMAAIFSLGPGAAQASPIPEITFDTTSSTAACFNCVAGGPFLPLTSVLNLTYNNSTFGGQTSGGFLAVGAAPATPNVNNLGSLTLGAGPASYAGTNFRLEVTFVLDPPANVLPENTPEFTAVISGSVSGGVGGIFVAFDTTPQAFSYTLPNEVGNFSFSVNNVGISPGGTVPLTGQVTGGSSRTDGGGQVPEPGVTLLLGSALAALAFVARRATRSQR
jgi:hypothetical protein